MTRNGGIPGPKPSAGCNNIFLSGMLAKELVSTVGSFLSNSVISLQNLNRETILEAINGKHLKALDIFTYSIHYLHKTALEVIGDRTGDANFTSCDVQWVLTVPAIWKPEAKQFMREAAYKVNVNNKK